MCDMVHPRIQMQYSQNGPWWDGQFFHMRDMTNLYVWHDAFVWVTWLICVCNTPHSTYVTCLIHICDMTHSYVGHAASHVRHASFIRVTRLIHTCDTPHSFMCHAPFLSATFLYSYTWHDSFIRVTQSILTSDFTCFNTIRRPVYVTWLISVKCKVMSGVRMDYVTRMNESCHVYTGFNTIRRPVYVTWLIPVKCKVMSGVRMDYVTRMNE